MQSDVTDEAEIHILDGSHSIEGTWIVVRTQPQGSAMYFVV